MKYKIIQFKKVENKMTEVKDEICEDISVSQNELLELMGKDDFMWTPRVERPCRKGRLKSQQLFPVFLSDMQHVENAIRIARNYGVPILGVVQMEKPTSRFEYFAIFAHFSEIDNEDVASYVHQLLVEVFGGVWPLEKIPGESLVGRNVVYSGNGTNQNCFDIEELTIAFIWHLKRKHTTNYKGKLNGILKKTNIHILNGFPCINIRTGNESEFWPLDSGAESIYINREVALKSNGLYAVLTFEKVGIRKNSTNSISDSLPQKSNQRGFDFGTLAQCCALYRELIDGGDLKTSELIGLVTAFNNIKGGKKNFQEILYGRDHPLNLSLNHDWDSVFNLFSKISYNTKPCQAFCRYCEECMHDENLIKTQMMPLGDLFGKEAREYVNIRQAEENLNDAFIKAVKSRDESIHIIKAQTGIGKSTAYINFLTSAEHSYIIAVPTTALKDEIAEKLRAKGILAESTPEMPSGYNNEIDEEIKRLYMLGAGRSVNSHLKRKIKEGKTDTDIFVEYFEKLKRAVEFEGHIITTHARFLKLPKETIATHEIIIDEDILKAVTKTGTATKSDIELAKELTLSAQFINQIDISGGQLHEGDYIRVSGLKETVILQQDECSIYECKEIKGNLIDLATAKYRVKIKDFEDPSKYSIQYLKIEELPKKKIIILSATADAEIYKSIYPKRKVLAYVVPQAEIKGEVLQYMDRSYSRSDLQLNEELIGKLNHFIGDSRVITFKKYKGRFNGATEFHFGNTEGSNKLKGQEISIVGTPHLHEAVYKLLGLAVGCDVNHDILSPRIIEKNGYRFKFMTYADNTLRNIQLWYIEQELIQCIGRARVLREDVRVRVFSNYPIEQAKFIFKY